MIASLRAPVIILAIILFTQSRAWTEEKNPNDSINAKVSLTDEQLILLYKKYDVAIRNRDMKSLEKVVAFPDEASKAKVKDFLIGKPQDSSMIERKIRVALKNTKSNSEEMDLVLLKQIESGKYFPLSIRISLANPEEPKILYNMEELGKGKDENSKNPIAQTIVMLEDKLSEWKNLQDDKLKEKVTAHILWLNEQLTILRFAENEGIQLVPGFGTQEKWKSAIEECQKLTPEKVKERVMLEAEQILRSLRKNQDKTTEKNEEQTPISESVNSGGGSDKKEDHKPETKEDQ